MKLLSEFRKANQWSGSLVNGRMLAFLAMKMVEGALKKKPVHCCTGKDLNPELKLSGLFSRLMVLITVCRALFPWFAGINAAYE